jgi:hypothetical protein
VRSSSEEVDGNQMPGASCGRRGRTYGNGWRAAEFGSLRQAPDGERDSLDLPFAQNAGRQGGMLLRGRCRGFGGPSIFFDLARRQKVDLSRSPCWRLSAISQFIAAARRCVSTRGGLSCHGLARPT